MLSEITLLAKIRNDIGTSKSKRLRTNKEQIPAVIYIKHKTSLPISIDHNKFYCMLQGKHDYTKNITIKIEEKLYIVMINSIQYHQCKKKILHVDFKII